MYAAVSFHSLHINFSLFWWVPKSTLCSQGFSGNSTDFKSKHYHMQEKIKKLKESNIVDKVDVANEMQRRLNALTHAYGIGGTRLQGLDEKDAVLHMMGIIEYGEKIPGNICVLAVRIEFRRQLKQGRKAFDHCLTMCDPLAVTPLDIEEVSDNDDEDGEGAEQKKQFNPKA